MTLPLNPGRYYLQVAHMEGQGVGRYGIAVVELEADGMLAKMSGEFVIKAVCPLSPGSYSIVRQ